MRGTSAYYVLYDEIADFKVSTHPCQQEIDGEFCVRESAGHFDSHGWCCTYCAQHLGLIEYTDY
jgi:hypothetical protein